MRLAVSNIAWLPSERHDAYALLRDNGIQGLEIAPAVLFHGAEDPFVPSDAVVEEALLEIGRMGLKLVSMQSLLFGVNGAALFGTSPERALFAEGLKRAISLACRTGIPNLVFGSPKQRLLSEAMTASEGNAAALPLFRELGELAASAHTKLGIEANPAGYGGNYLTKIHQAEAFVREAAHPAITLILDVGGLHMSGSFAEVRGDIARVAGLLSHVHMSEPFLAPSPADPEQAAIVLSALAAADYSGWVSIEMKRVPEDPLGSLRGAVGRLLEAKRIAGQ